MNVHQIMLRDRSVSIVADLRNYISSLPETKSTFKLVDAITSTNPSQVLDEHLWMANTWRVPEGLKNKQYVMLVNPNAYGAKRYAEATVPCECGTIVGRAKDISTPQGELKHSSECLPEWKYEAIARLWRIRRKIVLGSLHRRISVSDVTPRLGVASNDAGSICRRLKIDVGVHKKIGRRAAANTLAILIKDYNVELLGEAYGMNRKTVTTYAKRGGYDPKQWTYIKRK